MNFKSLIIASLVVLFSCTKSGNESASTTGGSSGGSGCGYHNGHPLYKGPSGGCYYINSNGNKVYVDRNECHC